MFIGEDIVLTIIEAGGGRVRLTIEAPRDVPVYREVLLTAEASTPAARRPAVASRYGLIGDCEKSFHRPECECQDCSNWRRRHYTADEVWRLTRPS